MSYSRLFVILLLCCQVCLVGCGETTTPQALPDLSKLEDDVIVAGFGTKSVHLGMSVDELGPNWVRGSELYPDLPTQNHTFYNRKVCILFKERDGRIEGVRYFYDPNGTDAERPFAGRTQEGIEASSTIENVIKTYGQPETIMATIADGNYGRPVDLMRDRVTLRYLLRGFLFDFRATKLSSIEVYPPDPDYDRELYQDAGPVALYRAIKVSEKKDED
jgi:hypothetical protein